MTVSSPPLPVTSSTVSFTVSLTLSTVLLIVVVGSPPTASVTSSTGVAGVADSSAVGDAAALGGRLLVAGPVGWPGSAEVVNMQPPDALIKRGINALPTLGDGRQSGTSDSPSILNASPESAVGGGLAYLRTGDIVRIDIASGRCDMLVGEEELEARKRAALPPVPASQTPWQEIYRATVGQLEAGACMELALNYRDVAHTPPRHNH